MPPIRILIAEEDHTSALQLQAQLERWGHAVAGRAVTREEIIECVKHEMPDLLLTNVGLKGIRDGIDAAVELHDRHGIPFIFLCGENSLEVIDHIKKVEPLGCVGKPVREIDIMTAIEVAMSNRITQQRRIMRHEETAMDKIQDAISRFSAGISEQFQTVMGEILKHAEKSPESIDGISESLKSIRYTIHRSANVVRQLMMLGQQETRIQEIVELNSFFRQRKKLFSGVLEGHGHCTIRSSAQALWCNADPAQLERAISNILTYIGENMIAGSNVNFNVEEAPSLHAMPGFYALLALRYRSEPLSEQACREIFIPFSAAHAQKSATGLLLASAHGIIRQNNGRVKMQSDQDGVSTVNIFWPCQRPLT
jgi:signal transduction histidine kinase